MTRIFSSGVAVAGHGPLWRAESTVLSGLGRVLLETTLLLNGRGLHCRDCKTESGNKSN